ncbi:MarR family winged helix-turn-helix transcriptional regulator [Streptomyces lunalinharesii]|uniref:MarR family transcriptional regulator n=1 Tax=Streptomyces lunalinharesii TaxID=333384 RepID=A0ABP6EHS0_9ACTN
MREASKHGGADDPAPTPDEGGIEELARAADQLFYAMRRSRAATVGRSSAGLSLAQLALLYPLADDIRGEGLAVSKLASHADVSVPTATRMLKQLEATGVVTRRRSDLDERQVLIRLTEDGARRLAAIRTDLRARQSRALSHFTPQERRVLTTQLHELAGLITDLTPGPDR